MASPTINTANDVSGTVNELSITMTAFAANAGSNRFLEVWIASSYTSPATHDSVAWGGQSLTQRGTRQTGTNGAFTKWYLKEADFPSGATGDIVATFGSGQDERCICAIVYDGVNQSAPYRNGSVTEQDDAATTTPSISVTSDMADLVSAGLFAMYNGGGSTSISVTAGTEQCSNLVNTYSACSAATVAGASTAVITWSVAGTPSNTFMSADSLQGLEAPNQFASAAQRYLHLLVR